MAFHQGAEHGTRAAGSGVGTPVAGADGRVASEWVECSRVLSAERRCMENSEYLRIVTLLIAMIYDDIQRYNTLASPNDMNGDTFGDTIRLSGRGQQCLTGHS